MANTKYEPKLSSGWLFLNFGFWYLAFGPYIASMFDGPGFPKSLDEEVFNTWLENGRLSKIGYKYLLIIWDDFESAYQPVYAEDREEIDRYDRSSVSRERLIAVYDVYSESRIV